MNEQRNKPMNKQKVVKFDYHRNGISGLGFHVGIVENIEGGEKTEMLVIRFPQEADKATGQVVCAAFDLARLDKRVIEFFDNSFRGDHFHSVMDKAIKNRKTESTKRFEKYNRENRKTMGTKNDTHKEKENV